ncbi:hypothetical protein SCAR479_02417 [Seiridium cardinale]|uniref:Ubiquitin-like protease family profile domain-containing protein n=1 Tax=Seiridium cardinale TaxID=138064 RepID=A0ABR2X5W4_9PEZI
MSAEVQPYVTTHDSHHRSAAPARRWHLLSKGQLRSKQNSGTLRIQYAGSCRNFGLSNHLLELTDLQKKIISAMGFAPRNTLNDTTRTSRPPLQAPLALDEPEPPSKRQKVDTEESFPTSQAQFALQPEAQSTPIRRTSTSSAQSVSIPRKAGSVQSSSRTAGHANVGEFRAVEKRTQAPRSKRLRHKKPTTNSAANPEFVDDSEGEADDGYAEVSAVTKPRQQHEQVFVENYSNHFKTSRRPTVANSSRFSAVNGLKRKAATGLTPPSKQPRTSSPDPLAEPDSAGNNLRARRTHASYSESRRGEIRPTQFSVASSPVSYTRKPKSALQDNALAQSILEGGLRIKSAVSGDYAYPDPTGGQNEPCSLRVLDISTMLVPTSSEREVMLQYSYLTLDLRRIHMIKWASPSGCIVAIGRSIQPEFSAGAKLYLEFFERKDVFAFMKWVRMERREPITEFQVVTEPEEKLVRQLRHQGTMAKRGKVLRDSEVVQHPVGDDIKLMERQQQIRLQESRQPAQSSAENRQPRMRDSMKLPPSDDDPKEQATAIPETPTRTATRSTRTRSSKMIDQPSTPRSWTDENPDWVDRWRNSLVFPAHGKNRATVDKDDIVRLDEGQFLNDNLIIFGLRWLQHALERENPDIAERIYFHNTFFYDKLKPSRSSAGINYDSVKGWTSKVDLFTKDFIVVPINEYTHWYVAIIYNAPKLIPIESMADIHGSAETTAANPSLDKEKPTIVEQQPLVIKDANGDKDGTSLVETEMRRMSISSSNGNNELVNGRETATHDAGISGHVTNTEHESSLVRGDGDVQEVPPPSTSSRKKSAKKGSIGSRKHDPNQPKIITLDSLGSAHSPACSNLRQYLVAELKDKKGIQVSDPVSLGMTAKGIPLQENYCDCGLYLLGYIHELIQDPDAFVRGLLQYEEPQWTFPSSNMRGMIRELIFELQSDQQKREDAESAQKQEKKRQAAEEKRGKGRPTSRGGNPAKEVAKSASPRTQSMATEHSTGMNVSSGSTMRSTIDASSILRRHVPTRETKTSSSADASQEVNNPSSEVKTPTDGPEEPRQREQKTSMLEAISPPSLTSPKRSDSLGSDDTTKRFIRPLKSPVSLGETSDNPVDVDSSPLTKQLEQNLQRDQQRKEVKSPQRANAPLDADTPRASVEHQSAVSPLKANAGQEQVQTPLRSKVTRHDGDAPRTNIMIEIPSSATRNLKRPRDAVSAPFIRRRETGHRSEYFQAVQNRQEGNRFDRAEYVEPPGAVIVSDSE